MKLVPSYQLQVLQEEEFAVQMPVIFRQLQQYREEGFFSGTDGKSHAFHPVAYCLGSGSGFHHGDDW